MIPKCFMLLQKKHSAHSEQRRCGTLAGIAVVTAYSQALFCPRFSNTLHRVASGGTAGAVQETGQTEKKE